MVKLELSLNLGRRRGVESSAAGDVPAEAVAAVKKRRRLSKKQLAIVTILIVLAGGIGAWHFFLRQPAVANPFNSKTMASVQFPLYYPTKLPVGYRIDPKSLTEPQQSVVVFNLVGPKGAKLYISEEARSSTFDLGGFYKKFANLKETAVSDGAVAVGYVNSGKTEIASRANNKTWILSNTETKIPLNQLTTMMKSLTLSY